jgi:hypothetical protein
MPSYYKNATGFSYFQVPDRLMELRPLLQPFFFDLWLFLHYRVQHNINGPYTVLTDDQIVNHALWRDRKINPREISRARAALKKIGLLHYTKEGSAWKYFAVHPITGITLDPTEAARQAAEGAENNELAKVKAELAALKAQMASGASVMKPPQKREHSYNGYADTGQVEDDQFIQ